MFWTADSAALAATLTQCCLLQRREAGRRTYVNMMSGENKVSWTVKDLIPGGEYYFRVQAVNKIGGGEFVELRNPVIAEDQKRKLC